MKINKLQLLIIFLLNKKNKLQLIFTKNSINKLIYKVQAKSSDQFSVKIKNLKTLQSIKKTKNSFMQNGNHYINKEKSNKLLPCGALTFFDFFPVLFATSISASILSRLLHLFWLQNGPPKC